MFLLSERENLSFISLFQPLPHFSDPIVIAKILEKVVSSCCGSVPSPFPYIYSDQAPLPLCGVFLPAISHVAKSHELIIYPILTYQQLLTLLSILSLLALFHKAVTYLVSLLSH